MTLAPMIPAPIFLSLTLSELFRSLEPTTLGRNDGRLVRPVLGTYDTESWGPGASCGASAADEAQARRPPGGEREPNGAGGSFELNIQHPGNHGLCWLTRGPP